MAYNPFDKSLPVLAEDHGDLSELNLSPEDPRKDIDFAEKRVSKVLLLFSFGVIAVASVAVAVLALNLNVAQQQLELDRSNQKFEEESNLPQEIEDPIQNAPEDLDIDPVVEEISEDIEDPILPQELTYEQDLLIQVDLEGWSKYSLLDPKLSFYLPPSENPHIYKESGTVWSWLFESVEVIVGAEEVGFGEYSSRAKLAFSPDNIPGADCDNECAKQNVILISVGEYSGTLEDLLNQYLILDAQSNAAVEVLEGSEEAAVTALGLTEPESIQLWGTSGFKFKLLGNQNGDKVDIYIFIENNRKYLITTESYSPDDRSQSDLETILTLLEF